MDRAIEITSVVRAVLSRQRAAGAESVPLVRSFVEFGRVRSSSESRSSENGARGIRGLIAYLIRAKVAAVAVAPVRFTMNM